MVITDTNIFGKACAIVQLKSCYLLLKIHLRFCVNIKTGRPTNQPINRQTCGVIWEVTLPITKTFRNIHIQIKPAAWSPSEAAFLPLDNTLFLAVANGQKKDSAKDRVLRYTKNKYAYICLRKLPKVHFQTHLTGISNPMHTHTNTHTHTHTLKF